MTARQTKVKSPWRKVSRFKGDSSERVSLWLSIYASPMSMGWSDAYAVADCWRESDGRWMHLYNGAPAELRKEYVTHFAPKDAAVTSGPDGEDLDWWKG